MPGTSEHQLGLAVDLVDASYQVLDEAQASTPAQQWLMAHCWEYGFILRYPAEKQDITGIIYEPWHYRYVGRDHAQAIRQSGQCLEEFLQAEHPLAAQGLQTFGLEALWDDPGPFPPSEGKEGDLCGIEGGTVVAQVEGVCL